MLRQLLSPRFYADAKNTFTLAPTRPIYRELVFKAKATLA